MTKTELRTQVMALFPIPEDDALCKDTITSIIERATKKCFSKSEKVVNLDLPGSSKLPEATTVLKCVPRAGAASDYSMFNPVFSGTVQKRIDY